jgi:hypothetical protein
MVFWVSLLRLHHVNLPKVCRQIDSNICPWQSADQVLERVAIDVQLFTEFNTRQCAPVAGVAIDAFRR